MDTKKYSRSLEDPLHISLEQARICEKIDYESSKISDFSERKEAPGAKKRIFSTDYLRNVVSTSPRV
uniref:Uncharacterized protein n=1 Tax=Romanomermis culicivorax TaxID=13658 RepID=A0A915ISL4_ROMCU